MLLNLFIGLVNSFPKLFFYLDNKQKDEFNCYQRRNLNKRELWKSTSAPFANTFTTPNRAILKTV